MTKLTELKEGDRVKTDNGFTCMEAGVRKVKEKGGHLYIDCDRGQHFLEGQLDKKGNLVGIRKVL